MDPAGAPRVLQLVLSLNPGGTERLVLELVRRLHADIPMAVCCLDEPGAWASGLRDEGFVVTALGRGRGFRPALGRGVADAVRRHRATVIHAHHYSPCVYGCLSRFWQRSAHVVFTEHGRLSDAPPSAKRRLANRVMARIPRAVYAVSENVKHHLVGEGFAQSAIGVIYNGIDAGPAPDDDARTNARRDLAVKDDMLVVGTIARLDRVKDLGTLLEAAARFAQGPSRPPLLVMIIGDGPERSQLEGLATRLGIAPSVRFMGHRDDARQWLPGCDVYVNCSISEGVSLTILEAMAAGLPVIATGVGGTPEVVDSTCGRLVPARDPAALAEALADLSASPILRAALGAAARSRVAARFTLQRMIAEYREVYGRIG